MLIRGRAVARREGGSKERGEGVGRGEVREGVGVGVGMGEETDWVEWVEELETTREMGGAGAMMAEARARWFVPCRAVHSLVVDSSSESDSGRSSSSSSSFSSPEGVYSKTASHSQ